ncbi:MliC family protein [uncultured Desulfobulbus sp.]|uniref:MliC family protein n=1 Tax=uncultured Desulfobulbus sp. TaxID=239745 RepID=UPI0029C72DEA|nr:MliC family protein [uncultured Desulfobulbus sp.]
MTIRSRSCWLCLSVFWLLLYGGVDAGAFAAGPSFDCTKVATRSIEVMICADRELIELDRKLASVYGQAAEKAVNEHSPVLKSGQRGWIKGRNDCWKSDDRRRCVADSYVQRIIELQARYRLVAHIGPVIYLCGDHPQSEVVATFFQTNPPTLIAERGDQVSLMVQQQSASGARYQGRNESLWEHHGEALITWGYGAPEMRCVTPLPSE